MQLENITPRKAADWLKRNINNRPLSETVVDELAKAIIDGQWQVNGDAIRFDSSGDLTDGQHRLMAVIKAGNPVQSWVCRGIEQKAFDTIDRGHKRTNGHILARRGELHYNMLAAGMLNMWKWIRGEGEDGKLRPDHMDKILSKHGERLRGACRFAVHHRSKLLPPGELVCLVAWANFMYGEGFAEQFWDKVLDAQGLVKGSPQHVLFKRLTDNITGPTRLTKRARVAICIKAFNAWATGQSVKCLKYTEGEDFPQFVPKSKVKVNG
jgi:hypothetical protein